jgi:flagellar protein FlaG
MLSTLSTPAHAALASPAPAAPAAPPASAVGAMASPGGAERTAGAAPALALQPPSRQGTDEAIRLRENLQAALKTLSEQIDDGARQLSFSVDEALGSTVVKVHDAESGEVVRQIPSEAVLKVAHTLHDLKGLLLDQRG